MFLFNILNLLLSSIFCFHFSQNECKAKHLHEQNLLPKNMLTKKIQVSTSTGLANQKIEKANPSVAFRKLTSRVLIVLFFGSIMSSGFSYGIGNSIGRILITHQIGKENERKIEGTTSSQIGILGISSAIKYEPIRENNKKTIVFLPGNIYFQHEVYDEILNALGKTNSTIYTMNYLGMTCGESCPVRVSQWIEQSKLLIKKAINDADNDASKVTVFGHSMGGAIGTYAVSQLRAEGIFVKFVAQNTFSSLGKAVVDKKMQFFPSNLMDWILSFAGWHLDVASKFQSLPNNKRLQFDAKNDESLNKSKLGLQFPNEVNTLGEGHFTEVFSNHKFTDFHNQN